MSIVHYLKDLCFSSLVVLNIIMLKVLIGDIIIIIIILQYNMIIIIAILISYQTYYTTPLVDKKDNYIASQLAN